MFSYEMFEEIMLSRGIETTAYAILKKNTEIEYIIINIWHVVFTFAEYIDDVTKSLILLNFHSKLPI